MGAASAEGFADMTGTRQNAELQAFGLIAQNAIALSFGVKNAKGR